MGVLFGTDGIRGKANTHPMVPETALRVGRALVRHFATNGSTGPVVVGRDTRLSGEMLEHALMSGICAEGAEVLAAGVIPTPAVAALCRKHAAIAGVVISASHNPYTDNGIKLFRGDGFKLGDEEEAAIEAMVLMPYAGDIPGTDRVGRVRRLKTAENDYLEAMMAALPSGFSLKGCRIILDCANGASYHVAPEMFRRLGADVISLNNHPDGVNINKDCGSEHLEGICSAVKTYKADIGLAFDGDADRLLAVDETGAAATGDQLIAIFADYLNKNGRLDNNRVVTTVMSNLGLKQALQTMGIIHTTSAVGDRHVMTEMRQSGAVLGGEDSGHIIFLRHQTTGDGLLSALKLCEILKDFGKPFSLLKRVMTVFPQKLVAVAVRETPDLTGIDSIRAAISLVERNLGDSGRVLVRYSGTQPVCRVMVEGPDAAATEEGCRVIADAIDQAIGMSGETEKAENRNHRRGAENAEITH
ncbi:MAG: phosphoglucosamine mutase [Pseudomonadota bacterium]